VCVYLITQKAVDLTELTRKLNFPSMYEDPLVYLIFKSSFLNKLLLSLWKKFPLKQLSVWRRAFWQLLCFTRWIVLEINFLNYRTCDLLVAQFADTRVDSCLNVWHGESKATGASIHLHNVKLRSASKHWRDPNFS
jgi:hypothetical protein